jgi:hypothetical protein
LCVCVIPVHELSKCVTSVPERCSGLTAGPNGSRPVIRDDVAYLGGTRLPPRAAPHRPPATLSSAGASKAATATAAGRAGDTVRRGREGPVELEVAVVAIRSSLAEVALGVTPHPPKSHRLALP